MLDISPSSTSLISSDRLSAERLAQMFWPIRREISFGRPMTPARAELGRPAGDAVRRRGAAVLESSVNTHSLHFRSTRSRPRHRRRQNSQRPHAFFNWVHRAEICARGLPGSSQLPCPIGIRTGNESDIFCLSCCNISLTARRSIFFLYGNVKRLLSRFRINLRLSFPEKTAS
jgi:hypothetical protein